MKLTPLDIRRQEFKRVMRGYDPVEIDTFMEMTANEFEELLKSQKDMRDRVIELEGQLKDYRQIEKTLQQTLLQAQETTGKTYETARKEAELITRDAEIKSEEIIRHAVQRQQSIREEIKNLQFKRREIESDIIHLLNSLKELIETYHKQDEEFDKVEYLGK